MPPLWFLMLYFSLRKRRFLQKFLDSDLWENFGSTPKIEKFLRSVFYSPPIPFREFLIKAEMQVQTPKTV